MSFPGFTAQAALYKPINQYWATTVASTAGVPVSNVSGSEFADCGSPAVHMQELGMLGGGILPNIPTCGHAGTYCCAGGKCDPGLVCNANNICRVPCGACGQKCCPNQTCNAGSGCVCNAAGICRKPCGDGGQKCCTNQTCNLGFICGPDGNCQECGFPFEKCCPGGVCRPGAACGVNGICYACGYPGEFCCPGNFCEFGRCDPITQLCM